LGVEKNEMKRESERKGWKEEEEEEGPESKPYSRLLVFGDSGGARHL
jgi:hypothetical protein